MRDIVGSGFRSGSSPSVPFAASAMLLAVLAAAACDRPPPESNAAAPGGTVDAAFTVRDSAGVEIVVNHAPERPQGQFWSFDPEPAFVLGGDRTSIAADDLRDVRPRDRALGAVWEVSGLARLSDGRIAVLSYENRQLYLSHGDTNEIRQYSLDGTLVRVIRRTTDPVPVTSRARRARLDEDAKYLVAVNEAPFDWYRAFMLSMPRREFYPPVDGLFVDADGYLWVREWSDNESGVPDRWSVFSPEGRWLGILDGPPASSADTSDLAFMSNIWIGRDFFLAVRIDDLGVERVEGYRVRRY